VKVTTRLLPIRLLDIPETVEPCIVSAGVLAEKPEPTRVTVVPTEDEAGLTVTDVVSTVKPTELKPVAAIVWRPDAAKFDTVNVTVFVLTVGHA